MDKRPFVEWQTLTLLVLCYAVWAVVLFSDLPAMFKLPVLALMITLQSSLQHEVIHGHPFRWQSLNAALVYPSLNLFIPYGRFRDTHLAHHKNENLTDPYDDPESNYLSARNWGGLGRIRQPLMMFNNTLVGRMLLGPVIGQFSFMAGDLRLIRAGDRGVTWDWVWHLVAMLGVIAVIFISGTSMILYVMAAYLALAILKIRTFAEHQAHEEIGPRSIVVEDRGPLAFLFLNNNYHIVHHMHPQVPWYRLPGLYAARRERFLRRNQGYVVRNYWSLAGQYLFRRKDPVVHPLWHKQD